jgi:type IV secretory pathway TrbF-like protein
VAEALQRWIVDVRSRPGHVQKPGNLAILNEHWQGAYTLTDGEARRALALYMDAENPLKHKAEVEVSVTIESLSRYPIRPEDDPKVRVYHLEWSEDWKISGVLHKQPRFTGDFWTELRPDARKGQTELMTQKGVDRGKPGLYIMKFRWDQKLGGAK